MAIEDKKIEIPSFVKKMDDESIIKMAKDIALGEVNVYAPIENADSKIVGFKRVCLYDNLKNEKDCIEDELNYQIQEYKKAKRHLNLLKALKSRFEKIKLAKQLELLENEQSYISYITDSSEEPSLSLCKEDLAQTARDIKPFKM